MSISKKARDKKIAETLAEEHWEWLEKVLRRIYTDAFTHGYKHGVERDKFSFSLNTVFSPETTIDKIDRLRTGE